MPAGKGSNADSGGSKTVTRETFRPPWVKDDTEGLPPKPSNVSTKPKPKRDSLPPEPPKDTRPSWVKNRRSSSTEDGGEADSPIAGLRKVSAKPNQTQENGKESGFVRPQLKKVPPKDNKSQPNDNSKIQVKLNKTSTINKEDMEIDKATPRERNAIVRQDSLKKIPPKAPPMPPPAPAFPKPSELKPLSNKQKTVIDLLKARPKVRPDWSAMLKEVESGKKLKHVECNDRSKPLLTATKEQSQFIYESEKSDKEPTHNLLLKEIQQGVALRKTKTNDRSKPILEGLRKFRRQMTIEEQIIKSQSMASIPPEELADEADELDDIDKVRDDLQSTKQMLALELRNKEALSRDNKRFQTRIAQLETELEKERTNKQSEVVPSSEANEKLVTSLKTEAAEARQSAQDLEKKFYEASDQLDHTKHELEEVRKQKQLLEKKLQESDVQGKRMSITERKESIAAKLSESEEEPEPVESESEGSDNEEKRERKAQRDLKQLRNKLTNYKNKEDNAKQERLALKRQIKQLQLAMKDAKKKYKTLQKEVRKMEAMMKEVGDESEEETEKQESSESEVSETESETESSETESESDDSTSEAEDAPMEKKNSNLTERVKKHEGRLSALKKGNYMLKASVERLQDDLNKQKEDSVTLQQDLASVLAELD